MYVQVLLIEMHRRAATSALLSEWHKSRCSLEIGVRGQRSKVTKFSQTSTSKTQSKWLVHKDGSGEEGKLLGHVPNHYYLGYTKRRITLYSCFFLAYVQVIVVALEGSSILKVQVVWNWSQCSISRLSVWGRMMISSQLLMFSPMNTTSKTKRGGWRFLLCPCSSLPALTRMPPPPASKTINISSF